MRGNNACNLPSSLCQAEARAPCTRAGSGEVRRRPEGGAERNGDEKVNR